VTAPRFSRSQPLAAGACLTALALLALLWGVIALAIFNLWRWFHA
jgi:hypothetical protein